MIQEKLLLELSKQVNAEFFSAYIYLSMAGYCEEEDLPGFANFFKVQAKEELDHGMKIYEYVYEQNGVIELEKIDKPFSNFKSVTDAFEQSYAHEQFVTKSIYNLMDISQEYKDYATASFLKWFVDEQVEEESTFLNLLKRVKMAEGNIAALYLIDEQLTKRTYVPLVTTEV